MKRKINDKYFQSTSLKNDIYRKFEKQFKYCFLNPININDELYVEQTTNIYMKLLLIYFLIVLIVILNFSSVTQEWEKLHS